jgi:hypothetical protein
MRKPTQFKITVDYGNALLNGTGITVSHYESTKALIKEWQSLTNSMRMIRKITRTHDGARVYVHKGCVKEC